MRGTTRNITFDIIMNQTPPYKKWYNGAGVAPAAESETSTAAPGQILASGSANHDQAPPTNGESYDFTETVNIPWGEEAQGTAQAILANLRVSYKVEDWGETLLDNELLIDLTSRAEGSTGKWGGHTAWEKSACAAVSSGEHILNFAYQNITMPDPNMNRIICEYTYKAVALESGGKKAPEECPCGGNTGSMEGGLNTSAALGAADSAFASSSAGTDVVYTLTEDSMLWSCNMGVLRGLGAHLSGKVQLYTDTFGPALASPAALSYNHPMLAKLHIPAGGAVPGSKLEIHMGGRVIALRYYLDGSIAPIGVDTAGNGRASLTLDSSGTVAALKWQDDTGAAWVFHGSTGALLSYTSPEMVVVDDVSEYLVVKKSEDETYIRQIWSLWDGLLNIEDVTDSGYTIRLYTPSQVTGVDEDGYYTVTGPNDAFKTFAVSYAESGLLIVESTPGREDYSCTWTKAADGAWSMAQGSAPADLITTARVRTVLEPAETAGFEVWQLLTTVSKGGTAAACVCEVYQNSPLGNLLLTRVEGYGSTAAQTSTFEYDGAGNLIARTSPNGHKVEYSYDLYGRMMKSTEPWRAGDHILITDYTYANTSDTRYSSEIATITRWLRENGAASMTELSTETHTYTVSDGIKREEIRTTALGSSHTHLSVTETWTNDAPQALDKGRIRMTQDVNGVQTWYSYEASSAHGAIYTITSETRVNGEPVPGQSRRTVEYINAEGNTVREEEYILLPAGTWEKLNGVTHTYNTQNQLTGSTRDNGRTSTQELSCTGAKLWSIDEDNIRTDYSYDTARQLVEVIRSEVRDGETVITPETITTYTRDALGRVLTQRVDTGAMAVSTATQYDLAGRVVAETDVLGRRTTTAYSADGLTTTVTTPAGATFIITRHTDGSLASQSGTGQRALNYSYDITDELLRQSVKLADNAILEQTLSNGFDETVVVAQASTTGYIYTRSEYNAKGQLVKQYRDSGTTASAMAATVYEYDSMGNRSKETLVLDESAPADATKNRIRTSALSCEQQEDGTIWQVITQTRNNAAGVMKTGTQKSLLSESSLLESKTVTIDERGLTSTQDVAYTNDNTMARLHSETIPTSTLAATARVVDGFVTTQTDHSGITGSFTRAYTATGITRTATDGRGNTTTTHTDLAGRSISSTDAAGNTTATVYDAGFDAPSVVTNAQGKTSCYKYDLRGRKVAEWGTAIQPALFGYDDADNMTALTTFRADSGDITTDPSERTDGDTTTWAYHPAAGVELSKTYADNSQVVKTYDAFNRLATETNARGIVKTLSYDAATGLLTGISFSDDETPSQSFAYNILGQLTQVTDAAGTRTIAYNEYSEQQSDSLDSGAHTHLVTELRDSYGRSTGFTYARSGSTQFTTSVGYGEDGRIATAGFMHGGVNRQFSYGYLSGSNLLHTLTQPNGLTLTQSYEEHRDLLTGMQYHRGSTLVVERSYSYDTLGRPTNRSTARQGSVKNDTFTHNDRSELVSATLGTDAYSYSYDNIGNRKTAQEAAEEATAYDANNLNQYTAIQTGEEAAFVPTFDADGNQTKVKTSTGIWNVVYNAENRPVTFTSEDGATVVECTYDYMGRRHTRKITVNGSVTNYLRYIYRGYLQIAAINAVSGVFQWFILWDPTEEVATRPLGIRKDGTWYTYGWDLTKNICEVFGSDGYIKTAYTYTPYGAVTANGNVTQPIQWSSEYNDTELGLVYYNYRHYNPADGRWTGRDFEEGMNLYDYAFNSILLYADEIGLKGVRCSVPPKSRPRKFYLRGDSKRRPIESRGNTSDDTLGDAIEIWGEAMEDSEERTIVGVLFDPFSGYGEIKAMTDRYKTQHFIITYLGSEQVYKDCEKAKNNFYRRLRDYTTYRCEGCCVITLSFYKDYFNRPALMHGVTWRYHDQKCNEDLPGVDYILPSEIGTLIHRIRI